MIGDSETVAEAHPRRRLEADTRREQIFVAAQRLFAQKPYEDVSLIDIAEAAGTTRTNIYYHFSTKRDLFLEIVRTFAAIPAEIEPAALEDESRERHVSSVLGRWLVAVEQNREMFMTMLRASSSSDPHVATVLADSMRAWEDKLLVIVGLDTSNPAHHAMVTAYQAMVAEAALGWLERGMLTRDQVHAMLTQCLLALGRLARD